MYKRASDGRWVAKWRDIDGRWRYRYRRTRVGARAALRDALEQREAGIGGTDVTVGTWLDQWLDGQQGRPTSNADRRYRLGLLPAWIRKVRLAELTPAQVDRALREIADRPTERGKARATSTVAKVRSLLIQSIDQAHRWGMVGRNVARMVDPPSSAHRDIEPLTLDESRRLLRQLEEHRLHSLYLATVSCGLRRGEALGLRWSDVDLTEGRIRIRQQITTTNRNELVIGPPKSRRSARTIVLPTVAVEALRDRRVQWAAERLHAGQAWHGGDLVWATEIGTPTHPRNLLRHLHRTCEAAGIRRVSFHTLRHSAATLMLAAGVPERVIMDVLGHSTAAMMLRYQHVVDDLREGAAGAMQRLLAGVPEDAGVNPGVNDEAPRTDSGG